MKRMLILVAMVALPLSSAFATEIPSAKDIGDRLAPLTRSLVPGAPDTRGITNTEAVPDEAPSIDLEINFKFDSDALTSTGLALVGNVGRALRYDPRLAGVRMRIEGHTDAKGEAYYNQNLSERRAQTVRNALINSYGCDPALLESIGFGETRLLDPSQPEDGVNRRVRIVNLGGR